MLTDLTQRIRLNIVPGSSVLPHEIADPRRERRIKSRLQIDGLLRDPLIVGEVPDLEGYVLLDGTNRKRALEELGLPWVMVQVIDYADEHAVELHAWCHQAAMPVEEIIRAARAIGGAEISSLTPLDIADALNRPGTLAVVLDQDTQYAIWRLTKHPLPRAEQLRLLVAAYEDRMTRIDCGPAEVEERAQSLSDTAPSSLIAFQPFSRSQVVTMAKRRALIPAGITRHVIHCGRVLRVNLPLDVLGIGDLNAAGTALQQHLATLQPRLYREPTLLFDS